MGKAHGRESGALEQARVLIGETEGSVEMVHRCNSNFTYRHSGKAFLVIGRVATVMLRALVSVGWRPVCLPHASWVGSRTFSSAAAVSGKSKILFVTPPMVQLNTVYPATSYLVGFCRNHGIEACQADASIALALRLFSRKGLKEIHARMLLVEKGRDHRSVVHFLENFPVYAGTIDLVIRFLQGMDSSAAYRIGERGFLPEGPRFESLEATAAAFGDDGLEWAFGALGLHDRAKHLASLYLDGVTHLHAHARTHACTRALTRTRTRTYIHARAHA
jgi:hypothetical protein